MKRLRLTGPEITGAIGGVLLLLAVTLAGASRSCSHAPAPPPCPTPSLPDSVIPDTAAQPATPAHHKRTKRKRTPTAPPARRDHLSEPATDR